MLSPLNRLGIVSIYCCAIVSVTVWLGFTSSEARAQVQETDRNRSFDERLFITDHVTVAARKNANDLILVPIASESDRVRTAGRGTVVQDLGKFLLLYGDKRLPARRYGEGAQKLDTTIHLPGASFEPTDDARTADVQNGRLRPFGRGYYVVQLAGIATDDALDSIRALGFEVLQYVPNNAFFVYGDSEAAARTAAHSRVRWIGEYTSDQRVSNELKNRESVSDTQTAMYNIAVFGRADLDDVTEQVLNASGGTLLAKMSLQSSYFNVVRVEMPVGAIENVASIHDVVAIDSYENPSIEDERSSQIIAGNYPNTTTIFAPGYDPLTQFGVDGSGVTVAVSDDGVSIPGIGGFYLTAANTVNGPLYGATAGAEGGHGHLNASIIAGDAPFGVLDSSSYNYGLGVAPKAHIVNIPIIKSGYPDSDTIPANDSVVTPGPNGVKPTISNNSWGINPPGNTYDSHAATYDSLSRDASTAGTIDPLLFVFSAGNSGTLGLTRPKMAKNIISVGNSENLRSVSLSGGGILTADNIDDLSGSSSRGPAVDGRIKPDITAPGSVITGARAGDCSTVTNCFHPHHVVSSGTSHAAPQVTGAATLFTQYWKSTHAGANPSIALTKAAILLTGQEMNGIGTTPSIPNGNEGWGRVNMKLMLNTGVPMRYVEQAVGFSAPGEEVVYKGEIVDGTTPFRAAVVWTDPPGVVDPALVNNLDLTVTIGATVYRGNAFSGGLSVTGGAADTRNNVEQVRRVGEVPGTPVSITVRASALNGDGVIGNGDATDQHFALVVYNFAGRHSIAGRVADQNGRAVGLASVSLFKGPTLVAKTITNTFGYYRFANVIGGSSYNVVVGARRHTFTSQLVNLNDFDMSGINFTATGGIP